MTSVLGHVWQSADRSVAATYRSALNAGIKIDTSWFICENPIHFRAKIRPSSRLSLNQEQGVSVQQIARVIRKASGVPAQSVGDFCLRSRRLFTVRDRVLTGSTPKRPPTMVNKVHQTSDK
jgi:hypothetical protein